MILHIEIKVPSKEYEGWMKHVLRNFLLDTEKLKVEPIDRGFDYDNLHFRAWVEGD